MSQSFEFFFDLASPWTCLAFHNIQPLAQKAGATIIWRPFLVGGVHNQVNEAYVESRANNQGSPKWRQLVQSLHDWAAQSDVPMNFPSKFFPLRSVHAMRFCCALEDRQSDLVKFAKAGFDAHYTHQLNLDDPDVLVHVANGAGLDGETLRLRSQEGGVKEQLRRNTEEAVARGAFGSPSIFVPFGSGERLYFGNDQLPLVEWALRQEHQGGPA
ncbi:2-hydroxychromene-2-carboxylate isomerase [Hydrogenophaga sp. PAMC20947]|uniref:2-hydroxychromene-2-carboxylate isomerase n=1 Tax=Hydrogenophaga sp. PAMC20947 TaxID=2565558 RepID=UPI00109E24B5|nr:2-hydroxychromene-2-carboxylate isomerase [Hydrogenophaga sp. PAMC20947]QCB47352.1 2-hydroxychromene-2-carboxylate isomerase [Hydrogenophaga sp. PAMC20947]